MKSSNLSLALTPAERLTALKDQQPDFLKALNLQALAPEARLEAVNGFLASRRLRPLAGISTIVDMLYVEDRNPGFFQDVAFLYRLPNGVEYFIPLRFNKDGIVSDGQVFVTTLNGKVLLVTQNRPNGRKTLEIPRGFSNVIQNAFDSGNSGNVKVSDIPFGGMPKELKEEVTTTGYIQSVLHLGPVAQNTGTDNVYPDLLMVDIRISDETSGKLEGEEKLPVTAVTLERALELVQQRKINDLHSITALTMAALHVKGVKALLG